MLLSDQYDILYWHAAERLFEYIEQDKIASINDIISTKEIDGMFDRAVIDSISFEENTYALPMSYYQIGFYYHKPLFSKLGITEPHNWDEFLADCEVLKQNNVSPIYIGTKSNWPATAWFDYLNLRLNGIKFHQDLIQGKASYLDMRNHNVLKKIQDISQNNSSLVQEAYYTIANSKGITQFFDRKSRKNYADQTMPLIDDFLVTLNIEETQRALEKVRITIFTTQPINKNWINI